MDSAYVLDSYAIIAHCTDEAGAEKVGKLLKAALAGKIRLYMSVINFGEVYYNTCRERGREKADEALFMMEQLPVTMVDATEHHLQTWLSPFLHRGIFNINSKRRIDANIES